MALICAPSKDWKCLPGKVLSFELRVAAPVLDGADNDTDK